MKPQPALLLAACVLLGALGERARGETLHVDAGHGDDANPGTSSRPLKTIQAAADKVQPGDTVLVAPGRYREEITLKTAGSEDAPIVFRSTEKRGAVLDGAEPVSGFEPCRSAEEAGGNPEFKNLWVAEVSDWGIDAHGLNLFEGGERLYMAQRPEPRDWFYNDDREVFLPIEQDGYSPTSLIHSGLLVDQFNVRHAAGWDGAIVLVWSGNNAVIPCDLQTFDPATGKITFSESTPHINPGKDRFAIANHPRLIARPGQFAAGPIVGGRRKLHLWPHQPETINQNIRASARKFGFFINGMDHVTIDGFCIERYAGGKDAYRAGMGVFNLADRPCRGIRILNNEIRECRAATGYWALAAAGISDGLIEGNYVHHNHPNRGIGATGTVSAHVKNVVVRDNIVERGGGTGINFYYVEDGMILGNRVVGNLGNHANGITVYLFSKNILVAGNTVLDGNMAVTVQQSSDITICNNLLTARREPGSGKKIHSRVLTLYGPGENIRVLNNTVLYSSNGCGISIPKDPKGYVVKNNITDGIGLPGDFASFGAGQLILENNIYLALAWNMAEPAGQNSPLLTSPETLFVDFDQGDFRLSKTSPAIDAGADTAEIIKTDIVGVPRPQGKRADIGAYEYKPD